MNVPHEFKLIQNSMSVERHLRSYEIHFNFPAFRTKESSNVNEVNVARLAFLYIPKAFILEFHSFQEYINKYIEIPISLEIAAWSILDDVFTQIQPCFAQVSIGSELPDSVTTHILASRGWRKKSEKSFAQSNLMEEYAFE